MTTNQTAPLGPHTVKRIGFGAMQLAGPGVFGPPRDPDAARAVLRRALELGVDHIDTSQFYGPDVVNELIREALHPYPADLKIVSKVGARRDDAGAWLPALHPDELRAGVEANLATLGADSLALVNLRLAEEDERPDIPLADQLGAMEDLRREGKIEAIGISNASVADIEAALELVELGQVQNAYNIKLRGSEEALRLCAQHGIAFVPFFPLGSAFTGGPKAPADDPAISSVAAKHDATRPRSPSHGCCTAASTSCLSRGLRRSLTSRRTSGRRTCRLTTTISPRSRTSSRRRTPGGGGGGVVAGAVLAPSEEGPPTRSP